jgi:origin recognition complex subunit 6
MTDLCFDVFGIAKEKKDPKTIKGNRGTYYILIVDPFLTSLCC